jgi:hypothetical protein
MGPAFSRIEQLISRMTLPFQKLIPENTGTSGQNRTKLKKLHFFLTFLHPG